MLAYSVVAGAALAAGLVGGLAFHGSAAPGPVLAQDGVVHTQTAVTPLDNGVLHMQDLMRPDGIGVIHTQDLRMDSDPMHLP